MKRFISCSINEIPAIRDPNCSYITQYSKSPLGDYFFAPDFIKYVKRLGVQISTLKWDFLTIALTINAIDNICLRGKSPDGWTRVLDVSIHVQNPLIWNAQKRKLEDTFKFLTGDFWHINFESGGVPVPGCKNSAKISNVGDCVCTLSGGMDSLIGAIDLVNLKKNPIFISRKVNSSAQSLFAEKIAPNKLHCQWGFSNSKGENSTRGRSIVFIAFGVIVSDLIKQRSNPVELYIPENGFISINPPLYHGRIGSLSTKTTHPVYINGLQDIFSNTGINVEIKLPYKFSTKGEMIQECKDQKLLQSLLPSSVSCGKYGRKQVHCGRCVPCLIRRAALSSAGFPDLTHKGYTHSNLQNALKNLEEANNAPSDIGAMLKACYNFRQGRFSKVIGSCISFAKGDERLRYQGVLRRGFEELSNFLIQNNLDI